MANLPSQHPNLSFHLTDRALTPLITSSRAQQQLQCLTSLSHTALLAHEAALRLGLGSPQRIMVEHSSNGPVLLHSFLSPAPTRANNSMNGQRGQTSARIGLDFDDEREQHATASTSTSVEQLEGVVDTPDEGAYQPPMLMGIVLAPNADSTLEARRAAARLERVGREVQAKWSEAHQQDQHNGQLAGN